MKRSQRAIAAAAMTCLWATQVSAVIILQREDRNLGRPSGSIGQAWDIQGQFGNFNATPISPTHFIAAKHIGGAIGQTFLYGTQAYTTASFTDIAGTDLRVWEIDTVGGTRAFSSFASIWNPSVDGSESGRPLVVFGRGAKRGEAVYAPIYPGNSYGLPPRPSLVTTGEEDPTPTIGALLGPAPAGQGDLRGWKWGTVDAQASWGQNRVEFTVTDEAYGELIGFNFDSGSNAVPNEAILAVGDSSGGVFAQAASGQWKLIGVNLGVDGPFSSSAAGPYFNGAIFDARGLFTGSASNPQYLPFTRDPLTASSYSTRVASYLGQLSTITGQSYGTGPTTVLPEPALAIAVVSLSSLLRRRR